MSLVRGCRLVTLYSCTPPRWLRHVSPPCSYFLSQVRLSAGHRLRRHLDVGCRDTQGADTHAKNARANPEFLPGKRALAIALCVYHTVASTILYQAPRFIPHTFGAWFES